MVMIAWASFVAFIEMIPRKENLPIPPPIAETISLEPLTWEAERPVTIDEYIDYDETVNRCLIDVGSVNETVEISSYHDSSFWLWSNVTVDLTAGYVHSINITAQDSTPNSLIRLIAADSHIVVEGLSVFSTDEISFISLYGVNLERWATLRIVSRWTMNGPDNQTEQATVNVEVIYFNGTTYKKTTCPLSLKATGCINTNIENAEEIKVGQTITKRALAWKSRPEEFYKVHLDKNEFVNITMFPPQDALFDLYVYNSSDLINPNFSSKNPHDLTENIIFSAYETSWYFIKVTADFRFGIYILIVDIPIAELY